MTSIFENTNSKVIIHLLHDDTLTEDNRDKFIRTAEKYSQQADFIDVTEYRERIGKDIAKSYRPHLTIGTLYRLLTWEVLDIDKVIYLDCDVFVNLDIRELWEINIDDKYLAASLDSYAQHLKGFSDFDVYCALQGSQKKTYFNAGILIMNLKKIRERENFLQTAITWLRRHPHISASADQDVFNSLLSDGIKFIDGKYNCQNVNNIEDLSGKIIHAGANAKLWGAILNPELSCLYWKTYLLSAWGENCSIEEIINRLCTIAINPDFQHKKSKQCLKRLIKRFMMTFNWRFWGIIRLLVQDVYYRIKYKFSR